MKSWTSAVRVSDSRGVSSRPVPAVAGARIVTFAFLLAFAGLWFTSLGQRALLDPDEGRYATLALEMARSGDWITPRLNGLLYFEKPPLQYWIGAASIEVLGATEFAVRMWPALAGFLTVLLVGYTATRLWGRETGLRAFVIAGSTTWIVGNSHFVALDAGLTFFLTVTLCALLLAEGSSLARGARRRWVWLAWIGMAGAVLSKGLIGVLIPGMSLILACMWRRNWGSLRRLHWWSGLPLFLILTVPWFAAVSMRNPGFAEFFFIHEHFARYLTNTHRREGSWWYFVPLLLVGLLPWTSALPWLGRDANADGQRPARVLLVAWCGFVLVFFSLSGSKLPSYILPMFPALTLLCAHALRTASPLALRRHLLVPVAVWVALAAVAATQRGWFVTPTTTVEAVSSLALGVAVGAIVFLSGAALAWWCLERSRVTAAVASIGTAHLIAFSIILQSHDVYGQLRSSKQIVQVVQAYEGGTEVPVFTVATYDQTLPFYLGRSVVLVDYVDEFALGQRLEPARATTARAQFIAQWNELPKAAAYMKPQTFDELERMGLRMHVVFRDARRVVVIKP